MHERCVVRLPRGCASRFPGRWAVVLALRTRRKINTRLWVCLRGDVLQVLPAGSGVRNLDVFHDREGFTTVWSNKSFAIMKIRSGVRIAAAGRGQPGRICGVGRGWRGRGPLTRARAGHFRFCAGHHGAYHKRQGRFPNQRVIARRALTGSMRHRPASTSRDRPRESLRSAYRRG